MKRLRLKLYGNVHGVGMRITIQAKAQELGLTGWVKNVADATVEVVLDGDEKKLKEFLAWCESGEKSNKIERVKNNWQETTSEFSGFKVRY